MPLNYTPSFDLLTAGNATGAVISTYTIPLGPIAWFLVVATTIMLVYIKTQNVSLTAMVSMLWAFATRTYLGFLGDAAFALITVACIMIVLIQLWKGD